MRDLNSVIANLQLPTPPPRSRRRRRPRRSRSPTRSPSPSRPRPRSRLPDAPTRRRDPAVTEIGVFGGSGFYSFLEDGEEVEVETPYGTPSAPPVVGEVGGKRVAFLPRHGRAHELPPHRIHYRANVWAMRELGVRRIIGPNASGALRPTSSSASSSSATSSSTARRAARTRSTTGRETTHVSAADPYCADLRAPARRHGARAGDPGRRRRHGRRRSRGRASRRARSRAGSSRRAGT